MKTTQRHRVSYTGTADRRRHANASDALGPARETRSRSLSAVRARGKAGWIMLVATALIAGAILAQLNRQPPVDAPAETVAPAAGNVPAPERSAPVESLVAPLAARLAQDPDDPAGWTLLAQSYEYMGQHGKAAEAYRQAMAHGSTDPAVAEALTAAEDRFISQTLLGDSSGVTVTPAVPPSPAALPAAPAAGSGVAIRGTVTVAPALADRVAPGDTLFVYARAADGPPMPLAVVRASASALPLTFTLDDSTSMVAGNGLSSAGRVTVIARVSKSGNAISQPGDLYGQSAPLDPRAGQPLELQITEVVSAPR